MTSPEVALAARRGARSLRLRGWVAAECEEAAVEEVVRRGTVETGHAWRVGRFAAIDELRRLTHNRRQTVSMRPLPLNEHHDPPVEEHGFTAVEDADWVRRLRRLTTREAEVAAHLAAGATSQEVARRLGVDPSRVTQLKRKIAMKLRP